MTGTWLLAAVLLLVPAGAGEPVEDAMTKDHLEPLLKAGDHLMVMQTFKRHPGEVLGFIDSYLEGGLKLLEEGGERQATLGSYRWGVSFAKLATEAFDDPTFVDYAASFASWSSTEQRNFRQGQHKYRDGRKAEKAGDFDTARDLFEQSRQLAEPLGDTWGEAMAIAGLARAHDALGQAEVALDWARHSARLYRKLRLHGSEARMLALCSKCATDVAAKVNYLRNAWYKIRGRAADDELRVSVQAAYAAALDDAGRADEAAAIRAR